MADDPTHSSTPMASSFPPPRPHPVSRFTPPSSPTLHPQSIAPMHVPGSSSGASTTASRTSTFPVPRRTPILIPRPKLPSPRSSPGTINKFRTFKLPTPTKNLPLPRLTPSDHDNPKISGPSLNQPRRQTTGQLTETTQVQLSQVEMARKDESSECTHLPSPLPLEGLPVPVSLAHEEKECGQTQVEEAFPQSSGSESTINHMPLVANQPISVPPYHGSSVSTEDNNADSELLSHPIHVLKDAAVQSSGTVVNTPVVAPAQTLPEGWIEQPDPNSGKFYYFNTVTRESTWDVPRFSDAPTPTESQGHLDLEDEEYPTEITDMPISIPLDEPDSHTSQIVSEASGVNLNMDVTDSGTPVNDSALSDVWIEVLDPTSGRYYYYNASTNQTSWEKPPCSLSISEGEASMNPTVENLGTSTPHDDVIQSVADAYASVSLASNDEPPTYEPNEKPLDTLPEGWISVQDPTSGNVYFYNETTQQTSWEIPFERDGFNDSGRIEADAANGSSIETFLGVGGGNVDPELHDSTTEEDRPSTSDVWTEVQDPTTGSGYFLNPATGETSWTKPSTERALELNPVDASEDLDPVINGAEEDNLDGTDAFGEESLNDLMVKPSSSTPPTSNDEIVEFRYDQISDYKQPTKGDADSSEAKPLDDIVAHVFDVVGMVEDSVDDVKTVDSILVPQGWAIFVDTTNGRPYYYNSLTNEATWEMPSQSAPLEQTPLSVEGEMNAEISAPGGFDSISGFEGPTENAACPGDGVDNDPETEIAEEEQIALCQMSNELPKGWSSGVDPSSGTVFYFNGDTGETSWEAPTIVSPTTDDCMTSLTSGLVGVHDAEITPEVTSMIQSDSEPESTVLSPVEAALRDNRVENIHANVEHTIPSTGNVLPRELYDEFPNVAAGVDLTSIVAERRDEKAGEIHESRLEEIIIQKKTLSHPWIEETDPTTGRSFFFNPETLESSWDQPGQIEHATAYKEALNADQGVDGNADNLILDPHSMEMNSEPDGVGISDVDPDVQASGWTEVVDPISNKVYYYEILTGEVSWERPQDECAIDKTKRAVEVAGTQLSRNGRPNVLGIEEDCVEELISKKMPDFEDHRPFSSGSMDNPESEIESHQNPPLPFGWVETVDAIGSRYFLNETTNETSWERPSIPYGAIVDRQAESVPSSLQISTDSDLHRSKSHESRGAGVESAVEPCDTQRMSFEVPLSERLTAEDKVAPRANDLDLSHGPWSESDSPKVSVASVDAVIGMHAYISKETNESAFEHPSTEKGHALTTDSTIIIAPLLQMSSESKWARQKMAKLNAEQYRDFRESRSDKIVEELVERVANPRETTSTISETSISEAEIVEPLDDASEIEQLSLAIPFSRQEMVETLVEHCQDASVPPQDHWVEAVDTSTGSIYYYNELTNETTWERPINFGRETGDKKQSTVLSFATPSEKTESDEIPLSEVKTSGGLINPLQTNSAGVVESDHVDGMVVQSDVTSDIVVGSADDAQVCESAKSEDFLPEGWIEVVDAATGLPYYFNETTSETSWDKPIVHSSKARHDTFVLPLNDVVEAVTDPDMLGHHEAEREGQAVSKGLEPDYPLHPLGWVALVDQSGSTYYFNAALNLTSWEIPLQDQSNDFVPEGEHIEGENEANFERVMPTLCNYSEKQIDLLEGWVEVEKHPIGEPSNPTDMELMTSWQRPDYPPADVGSTDEAAPPTEMENMSLQIEESLSLDARAGSSRKLAECEGFANADQREEDVDPGMEDAPGHTTVDNHAVELLDEWVALVDVSSGRQYYLNKASGFTSWERPVREGALQESKSEAPAMTHLVEPRLAEGWIEINDPDTGASYFFNQTENKTSWDRPEVNLSYLMTVPVSQREQGNNRPPHAFASFGFGGRLCVFRVSARRRMLEVHKVRELVPSHPVVKAEEKKRRFGIAGALNDGDDSLVSSYIASHSHENSTDLLWNLVQIASQSEGRLRSDEGVADIGSPESSIIQLLLQAETSHDESHDGGYALQLDDMTKNQTALHGIESLLLHGKRDEAVIEAIASRQFAMALLIGSMCDRSTFQHAAKQFAKEVASSGSPLYTLALLFSGQLEPPSDSALELSGLVPTVWSDYTEELRESWKQHLCAIISNRTLGWDRIVLSLGDRLLELGDVHAAHCCFMICGCPVASIIHPASRMSLVGCDHLVPLDAALATDSGIAAFSRSEAYEWAKRKGNPDAVIPSLQGIKLAYAMILADLGYDDVAQLYVTSIRNFMGLAEEFHDDNLAEKSAPTIWALAESNSLNRFLNEFDQRLSYRSTPSRMVPPSSIKAPSIPKVTIPSNIVDSDHFILSETSKILEFPESSQASQQIARGKANRQPRTASKTVAKLFPPLEESVALSSTELMSSTTPSAPRASSGSVPITRGNTNSAPEREGASTLLKIDAQICDNNLLNLPPNPGAPPKASILTSAPPLASIRDAQNIETTGTAAVKRSTRETSAPSLAAKEAPESQAIQKQKKIIKAPISAPAQLQRTQKSPAKEPTSAQKRAWGLGGFRNRMTKWLNPEATTADLGGGMEAYYDEHKKVWVFPGEDPAELSKPIGPPPMVATPADELKKEVPNIGLSDPLAAMMAPPPRSISSLRQKPVTQLSGPPLGAIRVPGTPAATPPKFMVFTPKAVTSTGSTAKDEQLG